MYAKFGREFLSLGDKSAGLSGAVLHWFQPVAQKHDSD